uniref:Reverse transcriptase domain-containing protein n=1 Tax=Haemonchus contortus TaxID=6289 RepID=A0A7I4Z3I8_HAECO
MHPPNIYCIMKGNGESHLRLLLGSLRQPRLPAYPPSWARRICRSSGSPFRNPTCHNVAKNCTAPGPDRIKPEHPKSLPLVIVRVLARLFSSIARVQNALSYYVHRFEERIDTVETEAVIEALGNQGVPTLYITMLQELYDNFKSSTTTRISPFYKKVIINVKRGVRQGNTISPKFFSAALENTMRHLEWKGLRVDGRYLYHLRFADGMVLIGSNIEQAD